MLVCAACSCVAQVGGAALRPHLDTMLGALLEGISSLEPQMLSYLQFHTGARALAHTAAASLKQPCHVRSESGDEPRGP